MARPKTSVPGGGPTVKIWHGKEGWQGWLTIGLRPDGSPDRRKRRGKDQEDVRRKLADLQERMKTGTVAKPGPVPTLTTFLTNWLNNPDAGWRYQTIHSSYGWAVNTWLIPNLGKWRLDRLADNPKEIENFLRSIARDPTDPTSDGLASSSVCSVFRALRAALNVAVRDKIIPRSPIDFMTWRPKLEEEEITPLFVDEVQAILRVCEHRRNGTRWSIALPLGLRQGEALGLPWMQPSRSTRDKPFGLDPTGWLVVHRKAERHKWQHGCDDPIGCAAPHCRTTPCRPRWQHGCGKEPALCTKQRVDRCPKRISRPDCATHRDTRNCAKICKPGCVKHATLCPKRHSGGIVFTDTKSKAGDRRIALAPQMHHRVTDHLRHQQHERTTAGEEWEDFNLVWCQPNGRPIDASRDREEWKDILQLAGVRDARIHDGRHTAATMLLLQGVDEQTVMAVMGWSDRRMLQRYQHVIDELRQEASRRVGALLWGADEAPKRKKKKAKAEKKRRKQGKERNVDESTEGFGTDLDTGGAGAKIIALRRSA